MYRRILFPTDLSKSNRESVPKIAELASILGATVEVLHVLGRGVPPPPEEDREGDLKPFLDEFKRLDVMAEPKHRYGYPDKEIIREIEEKGFDLVIMPIYPRHWAGKELPSDPTALRVAKRTTCDVILVKSAGRK